MLSPTDSTPERNPSPTPFSQIFVDRDSKPNSRLGAAPEESSATCVSAPSSTPTSINNQAARHCAIPNDLQRGGVAQCHRRVTLGKRRVSESSRARLTATRGAFLTGLYLSFISGFPASQCNESKTGSAIHASVGICATPG